MLPKELTEAKKIETAALSTYLQAKSFREAIEKKLNKIAPEVKVGRAWAKREQRRLKTA